MLFISQGIFPEKGDTGCTVIYIIIQNCQPQQIRGPLALPQFWHETNRTLSKKYIKKNNIFHTENTATNRIFQLQR